MTRGSSNGNEGVILTDSLVAPLVDRKEDTEDQEVGTRHYNGDSYQKGDGATTSSSSINNSDGDILASAINGLGSLRGRLLLLFVAFLYGSLNVTLRLVYSQPEPPAASVVSSARQWLAVLAYIPLVATHTTTRHMEPTTTPSTSSSTPSSSSSSPSAMYIWFVAAQLAFCNVAAQGMLAIGLLSTPSARASFFFQSSVVMTPLLSALAGQRPHWKVWLSCAIALVGLVCLSDQKGFSLSLSMGDIFCLLGACSWSCYIFRLSNVGGAVDEIHLQGAKTVLMSFLYSTWFGIAQWQSDVFLWEGYASVKTWLMIAYTALGPGALADILQQKGQSTVTAAEANVILSLEPVFTTTLAMILLGEGTTFHEKVGGALIILASLISSTSS